MVNNKLINKTKNIYIYFFEKNNKTKNILGRYMKKDRKSMVRKQKSRSPVNNGLSLLHIAPSPIKVVPYMGLTKAKNQNQKPRD